MGLRPGLAPTPEASEFTSLHRRLKQDVSKSVDKVTEVKLAQTQSALDTRKGCPHDLELVPYDPSNYNGFANPV